MSSRRQLGSPARRWPRHGGRRVRWILLALSLAALAVRGQWPAGPPFPISSDTSMAHLHPDSSSRADGSFVVVWESRPPGGDYAIKARLFASEGSPLTGELVVSGSTTGDRDSAAVAMEPGGEFVVVWRADSPVGGDPHYGGVLGRRFGSDGAALGLEFLVNVVTTGGQLDPDVAVDQDGDFVVVWSTPSIGYYADQIRGRRFASDGTPQPGEMEITPVTSTAARLSAIAMSSTGDFVVAWSASGADYYYRVAARRFTSSGAPQAPFLVSADTTGSEGQPAIAMAVSGAFVVAWTGEDAEYRGIVARAFSSTGVALTGDIAVNAYQTDRQSSPSVAMDTEGGFVVVWTDHASYPPYEAARARVFSAAGDALSDDLLAGESFQPASVVSHQPGNFIVTWTPPAVGDELVGQRFTDLVFADDFESGDLSRWKLAVGAEHLAVTAAAALVGSFGLAVDVTNGGTVPDTRYVVDDRPEALDRYRARFYLDPNGYTPGSPGERIKLFQLLSEVPDQRRLVTIVLRATGGYDLRAKVRADDGTVHDTGGFPVTDAPHYIEIAWQQSTAPGFDDGYLRLSLDGVEVAALAGVDNDLRAAEKIRLGALGIKPGTAGTIHLDAFESRRLAPIGPAP